MRTTLSFSIRFFVLLAAGLAITFIRPAVLVAQPAELGSTQFENSGPPEAQEAFLQGVLLLHSFEYEDAREAFQKAQQQAPDFALAYWGEAMTRNHPIWMRQYRDDALEALGKLAPTAEGRLAKAPTEREKAYLQAVHILFGEGDKYDRDVAYAEAMGRLAASYPDDLDAAAFHALALLGTSHGHRDTAIYMRAAAVVEEVFALNPHHPGAAHYLIHAYDDPVHAPLGLRAARAYAQIAPSAAHALHMPSHIFVAMGMWDDSAETNLASYKASKARAARKDIPVENHHALSWLIYDMMQQGRHHEARDVLRIMETDYASHNTPYTRRHLGLMKARFIIDYEQWDTHALSIELDTKGLDNITALMRFVDGWAAAHRGELDTARQTLAHMMDANPDPMKAGDAGVMALQLKSLILQREGNLDDALALMKKAVNLEEALPFAFGPPSVPKPSHESLAELLMAMDQPQEAQHYFERTLNMRPGRAKSLIGLAFAADALGDSSTKKAAIQQLATNWHKADPRLLQWLKETFDATVMEE